MTDTDLDELVMVTEATSAFIGGDMRRYFVFRHEASGWQLVHRHADALVHRIMFDRLAELARGEKRP